MPQSERSQIMKQLLRWLDAKTTKDNGASTGQTIKHVMSEISTLGATERRAQNYIETLSKLGLIRI